MKKSFVILFGVALLIQCGSKQNISPIVDTYIDIYQKRQDFDGFLDLYAEDMILEDMVAGWKIEGKDQFREFFNWPDTRFEKFEPNTFEILSTVVEGNQAVIHGYFTPFRWDSTSVEAMQFTTILDFDEHGKIVKHIDWINYPNYLIDYSKRVNSNEWINKD